MILLDVPFQFFCEDTRSLDARQFIERWQHKYHSACWALLLRPAFGQKFRYVHLRSQNSFLEEVLHDHHGNRHNSYSPSIRQQIAPVESTAHVDTVRLN